MAACTGPETPNAGRFCHCALVAVYRRTGYKAQWVVVQIDAARLKESLDRHRASPDVSIDEYVRSRQLALGQSALEKQRVYLDKNFWILARDAVIGRPSPDGARCLLDALRQRVVQGETVCPISESLFMELMKQSDFDTRRVTAQLIDELSTGVTYTPGIPRATALSRLAGVLSKALHEVARL